MAPQKTIGDHRPPSFFRWRPEHAREDSNIAVEN